MARNKKGWIAIDRKILDHWVYEDANLFRIWMTCLLLAQWGDSERPLKKQMIKLKRGQFPTSLDDMARITGVERRTVSRKLKMLEMASMLTQQVSHSGTIITICNYDKYQNPGRADGTADGTDDGTTDGTTDGTDRNNKITNKQINNFLEGKILAALALATGKLREQLSRPDVDIFSADIATEGFDAIGFEGSRLLKLKFPTWGQFAKTWIDQYKRGYQVAFERKLESELQAIATHLGLFQEQDIVNQNQDSDQDRKTPPRIDEQGPDTG